MRPSPYEGDELPDCSTAQNGIWCRVAPSDVALQRPCLAARLPRLACLLANRITSRRVASESMPFLCRGPVLLPLPRQRVANADRAGHPSCGALKLFRRARHRDGFMASYPSTIMGPAHRLGCMALIGNARHAIRFLRGRARWYLGAPYPHWISSGSPVADEGRDKSEALLEPVARIRTCDRSLTKRLLYQLS